MQHYEIYIKQAINSFKNQTIGIRDYRAHSFVKV